MTMLRLLRANPSPVKRIFVSALAVLLVFFAAASCNHEPDVTEVDYPYAEPGTIYFLEQTDGANEDDAALQGVLQLVDGCLRVGLGSPMSIDPAIVWPEGFSLNVVGQEVQLLDEDGSVVAHVGEIVHLGGSAGTESRDDRIGECSGPFWYAGWEVRTAD